MAPVLEVTTFRLRPDAARTSFEAADRDVQIRFAYRQPGLLRRTTAVADAGQWVVLELWDSEEEADAAEARRPASPEVAVFGSLVDPSTVRRTRYATLD